jgi:diacylglycerol kinase (ATP)
LAAFLRSLKGQRMLMDAGKMNDRFFFMAAGLGFEGEVAHEFAVSGSRGLVNYLRSSIKVWFRFKPFEVWEAGNPEPQSYFSLTFANGSQYGNNARIAPGAQVNDGLLQYIQVRPFPFWQLPSFVWNLMNGSLKPNRYYLAKPFQSLQLTLPAVFPGHLDGEPVQVGPDVMVEVLPDALWIQKPVLETV